MFNNPKVGKFFEEDCKLGDLDFNNKIEMRHKVTGLRSFAQLEEFVKQHADLIESAF